MKRNDERVEFRERLRELVRRLVDESTRRPVLRRPPIVRFVERAIASLDDLVNALADNAPEPGGSTRWTSCPVCDSDPELCSRGGRCARDPDRARRPEPWEAKTVFLPRSSMQSITEAVERVGEIVAPQRITDSAALSLVALDFVATHSFTRQSSDQALRFVVETFEQSMRLFIVVFDRRGNLLYGLDRLRALAESDPESEPVSCACASASRGRDRTPGKNPRSSKRPLK